MAAKNSKGLVIVQVERIAAAGSLNPRDVKIPGLSSTRIVVATPEHHAKHMRPSTTSLLCPARCVRRSIAYRRFLFDERKVIARRCASSCRSEIV